MSNLGDEPEMPDHVRWREVMMVFGCLGDDASWIGGGGIELPGLYEVHSSRGPTRTDSLRLSDNN